MGLDSDINLNSGAPAQDPQNGPEKRSKLSEKDEFGLTEEDYKRWAEDEDHESEPLFHKAVCEQFEMRRLEPGEIPPPQGVPKGTYYIGHLPGTQDWKGEGDFVMYIALKNGAHSEDGFFKIVFDLTTANPKKEKNAAYIKKKLDKEDAGGPFYLNIPRWAIEQAERGGHSGLSVVAEQMGEMIKRAADRARELRNK